MICRRISCFKVSTDSETLGCRRCSLLHHLSVGVQGGGEDDVPADGQGGLLHLAPQDGVSHDAGGLSHLLQHLVQALDAAHHRAFLDVGELGDLCEGLWPGQEEQEGEAVRRRLGAIT